MNIYYWKKIDIDIPLFWKNILKMNIPVILTIILGYLLNYFIRDYNLITFILKGFVYTVVYGILMWIIGLNKNEKIEILKIIKR